MASQNELKLTMPTFDASVMAAIQHLSQTNRNQIAALESNFKVLQQAQLSFKPPSVTSEKTDDDKGISAINFLPTFHIMY